MSGKPKALKSARSFATLDAFHNCCTGRVTCGTSTLIPALAPQAQLIEQLKQTTPNLGTVDAILAEGAVVAGRSHQGSCTTRRTRINA